MPTIIDLDEDEHTSQQRTRDLRSKKSTAKKKPEPKALETKPVALQNGVGNEQIPILTNGTNSPYPDESRPPDVRPRTNQRQQRNERSPTLNGDMEELLLDPQMVMEAAQMIAGLDPEVRQDLEYAHEHVNMARIFYQQGEPLKALKLLLDALEKSQHSPNVGPIIYKEIKGCVDGVIRWFMGLPFSKEIIAEMKQMFDRQQSDLDAEEFGRYMTAFNVCIPIAHAFRKRGIPSFDHHLLKKLHYQRATQILGDPNVSIDPHLRRALLPLVEEDIEIAKAFSIEPDRRLLVRAAEIKQEVGKPRDAMNCIEAALRLSPQDSDLLLIREDIRLDLEDEYSDTTSIAESQCPDADSEIDLDYLEGTNVGVSIATHLKVDGNVVYLMSQMSKKCLQFIETEPKKEYILDARTEPRSLLDTGKWEVEKAGKSVRLHVGPVYLTFQKGKKKVKATVCCYDGAKPNETLFQVAQVGKHVRLKQEGSRGRWLYLSADEDGNVSVDERENKSTQLFEVKQLQRQTKRAPKKAKAVKGKKTRLQFKDRRSRSRDSQHSESEPVQQNGINGRVPSERNGEFATRTFVSSRYNKTPTEQSNSTKRDERQTSAKKPRYASTTIYTKLREDYDILPACHNCMTRDADSTYTAKQSSHPCTKDQLYIRASQGSQAWCRIRDLPRYYRRTDTLCESVDESESCPDGDKCKRPHSYEEMLVWNMVQQRKWSMESLLFDLRKTTLVIRHVLLNAFEFGHIIQVCRTCFKDKQFDSMSKKNKSTPRCKGDHPWETDKIKVVFKRNSEDNEFIDIERASTIPSDSEGKLKTAIVNISDLLKSGFTASDILRESRIVVQTEKEKSKKQSEAAKCKAPRFRNTSLSQRDSRGSDDQLLVQFGEEGYYDTDISGIAPTEDIDIPYQPDAYDDEYPEEDDFSSDESDVEGEIELRVFYSLKTLARCKAKMESEPKVYKECRIRLQGAQQAMCTPLDNSNEIEIRGRHNCGPAFDGDIVIVQIMKVKKLDSDDAKRQGRVICVKHESLDREKYNLVCTVDQYHSHLMRPLCGRAPKIHVEHSPLQDLPESLRNNRVCVYENNGGHLEHIRTIELDRKRRNEQLFIVHYYKWDTSKMYPYGFVSKVIETGKDLESGQKVLNLMYQVPPQLTDTDFDVSTEMEFNKTADKRFDCTQHNVISIDPPGCQDIDDALSVREIQACGPGGDTENVQYEVGIHIADVTAFVEKDSAVDKEAFKRRITFYPVKGEPIHMLPKTLSTKCCSLVENENRFCLSLFVRMDGDGNVLDETPRFRRTTIRNRKNMSYAEAQQIIEKETHNLTEKEKDIQLLHQMAVGLRKSRLGEARYRREVVDITEKDDCAVDSHRLVEEFMILANTFAARFISERFPQHSILRIQSEPEQERFLNFVANYGDYIKGSSFFQRYIRENAKIQKAYDDLQKEKSRKDRPGPQGIQDGNNGHKKGWQKIQSKQEKKKHKEEQERQPVKKTTPQYVNLPTSIFKRLLAASNSGDISAIKHIISQEEIHPDMAVMYSFWLDMQKPAEVALCGEGKQTRHFSLQKDHYTWFTSPIRRSVDIIVHRLIIAALSGEKSRTEPPYKKEELALFCDKFNKTHGRQKRHDRRGSILKAAAVLKEHPVYMPSIIAALSDDGLEMLFPFLPHQPPASRMLLFRGLNVQGKPLVTKEKDHRSLEVYALWSRRIYDTRPNPESRRNKAMCTPKFIFSLNSRAHSSFISLATLEKMVEATHSDRDSQLLGLAEKIEGEDIFCKGNYNYNVDATSEMKTGEKLIRHHAKFKMGFETAQVVQIQMGSVFNQGLIEPKMKMLSLTQSLDICVEHTDDPVMCFADIATYTHRREYASLQLYQETWLPMLAMEAACVSAQDGDPIIINNIPTVLQNRNGEYQGYFELQKGFCDCRHINLISNTKDEEEDSMDYLCLKFHTVRSSQTLGESSIIAESCLKEVYPHLMWKNMWVAHALGKKVWFTKEKNIRLEFNIHYFNSNPPIAIEQAAKKSEQILCNIEFITKALPHKRMEEAVEKVTSTKHPLCQRIVLGQKLPPEEQRVDVNLPEDLNINVTDINFPRNNYMQEQAIKKSLTQKLTVIQGPPGTGKTLTCVKVAYWFCEVNKVKQSGNMRKQVMYCGPSNSAVDVAARLMTSKLREKCPKIVRIYGETLESQVFPIPRDYSSGNSSSRGRQYKLTGKKEELTYGLHHLIRSKTNSFSSRILKYDRLFAQNKDTPENVSDKEVDIYLKLITDAAMEEIPKYDIIFCTCSVSPSPRIQRKANIHQLIIDECGMCMEPESLVPLINFTPRQVVLVGDHKQLRPIVTNAIAKDLGLEVSLFERHANILNDETIMLDEQYRMHPAICSFPSREFYEGKLKTNESIHWTFAPHNMNIWPNPTRPCVFCHVEGAEKTLAVATDQGNENSKSNEAEKDHVVQMFFELVNQYNVSPDKITVLSQYKAQCNEIKTRLDDFGFVGHTVSTVVASQGDEQEYIILSTVRSLPKYEITKHPSEGWLKKNLGFITDEHQINVALTRAKKGMIIVGNKNLLRCHRMWRHLLYYYERHNGVVEAGTFPHKPDSPWKPNDPQRNRRGLDAHLREMEELRRFQQDRPSNNRRY